MYAAALVCGFAIAAVADAAPPSIGNLSLRGLQTSATTTLAIDGANLQPQPRLLLDAPIAKQTVRPGASAGHVEIEVALEGSVPAGIYQLRLATDAGVSPPIAIGVDSLPERPMSASPRPDSRGLPADSLPVALSGSLAGGEIASDIVRLKAGQQIVVEVEARRLGSLLDPVMHVYDHRGVPLAWAEGKASLGGDARLTFTAPSDGPYRVELHDAVYQAGNPGYYRLKIGEWNYAAMVFPPVVQRGTKTTLEFADTNLPANTTVELNMPADAADMPAPWPAGKQMSGFRPLVLASDVPEAMQLLGRATSAKQSDATKAALQEITAPAGISGRFSPAKEDLYRVNVEPNERLRFEVLASRIGSPVDCSLSIRDEHGGQMAANDDQPGTVDPGLDFTVPGNVHVLVVALKEVAGRGGPDCIYHLAVSRLDRPNFSLSLDSDRSEIPPGGMGLMRIAVRRTDYNGPIEISFHGLPSGITAKDTLIDAGIDEALVSLPADKGPATAGIVTIGGTATEGAAHLVRVAELPPAGATVWQPWLRSEFAVARTGGPSIDVAWVGSTEQLLGDPGATVFKPGEKVPLAVKFTRGVAGGSGQAAAKGAVRLSLVSSQPMPEKKVRVKQKNKKDAQTEVPDPKRALRLDGSPMIPAAASEATAQLVVPGDLPASEYELAIRAELLGADGKSVEATTYTPVLRINVAPPAKTEPPKSDKSAKPAPPPVKADSAKSEPAKKK
jgi:hypothetical protein